MAIVGWQSGLKFCRCSYVCIQRLPCLLRNFCRGSDFDPLSGHVYLGRNFARRDTFNYTYVLRNTWCSALWGCFSNLRVCLCLCQRRCGRCRCKRPAILTCLQVGVWTRFCKDRLTGVGSNLTKRLRSLTRGRIDRFRRRHRGFDFRPDRRFDGGRVPRWNHWNGFERVLPRPVNIGRLVYRRWSGVFMRGGWRSFWNVDGLCPCTSIDMLFNGFSLGHKGSLWARYFGGCPDL